MNGQSELVNCIVNQPKIAFCGNKGKEDLSSGTSSDGAVSLDQSFIQIPYESTMKIEHPRDSYGEHLPFLCNKDIKWVFHDEMHAFLCENTNQNERRDLCCSEL